MSSRFVVDFAEKKKALSLGKLRKRMKTFLFLVAVLIGYTSAHLCLIYPHQRGSANNLNVSGTSRGRFGANAYTFFSSPPLLERWRDNDVLLLRLNVGSDDCFLTKDAPCGGRDRQRPMVNVT